MCLVLGFIRSNFRLHCGELFFCRTEVGEGEQHFVIDGFGTLQTGILFQKTDGFIFGNIDGAVVLLVFACYETEQCGFAGTVDTDDTETVSFIEGEGNGLQNDVDAERKS